MIYYVGDTHFGHENIIKYCRRPFADAATMDQVMYEAIRLIDTGRNTLYHVGDFAFGPGKLYKKYGELLYAERHTLIMGNHDRLSDPSDRRKVQTWFRTIVGTREAWRTNQLVVEDKLPGAPVKVLLSHLPQRDLRGCAYNVYGHFHNNLFTQPEREAEWLWALKDERYLNAGVEITDYMPMTLAQLIQANEEAPTKVW